MNIKSSGYKNEYPKMGKMFSLIRGITNVRIEPLIDSMIIEYNPQIIKKEQILTFVSVFLKQTDYISLRGIVSGIKPSLQKDIFRSIVSGLLLLVAYSRKKISVVPDFLDYGVVISTAYTVLSHGKNKLQHPDVITGIVSMLSLGKHNILHVTLVTWVVNLLEIFHDIKRSQASLI
jgi:hypothetical protein